MSDEILLEDKMSDIDKVIHWHHCINIHFKDRNYDCVDRNYAIKAGNFINKAKSRGIYPYQNIIKIFQTPNKIKLFFIVCCLNEVYDINIINDKMSILKERFNEKLKILDPDKMVNRFFNDCVFLITKYGSINDSIKKRTYNSVSIVHEYVVKSISAETILILNHLFDIFTRIDKIDSKNIVWEAEKFKLKKYGSFIKPDNRDIFINVLTDAQNYVNMNKNKQPA